MNIKDIIKSSELHYTASGLIDEESFEQMIDELSDKIETKVTDHVMAYHRYLNEVRRNMCETKRKMEDNGWNSVCLEPSCMTFKEFCENLETE